jgi:hypothetical protein
MLLFYFKKYFFISFLILSLGFKNFLIAAPSDSTKNNNPAIKNSSNFKTGTGSVIKTSKWLFPVITAAGTVSYFYFNNQGNKFYKDYQNAASSEEANDLRAKTKSNDQSAAISGISALAAAAVSIFAWLYDNKNEDLNTGEEYKFILTSGRQLTGHLIREDFDALLIQGKDGAVTVKRSDISRIEKDGLVIYEK